MNPYLVAIVSLTLIAHAVAFRAIWKSAFQLATHVRNYPEKLNNPHWAGQCCQRAVTDRAKHWFLLSPFCLIVNGWLYVASLIVVSYYTLRWLSDRIDILDELNGKSS